MRYRCIKGFTFDTEEGEIGEVVKESIWESKEDRISKVLLVNTNEGWDSINGTALWIEIPKHELNKFFKPLLN